MAHLNICVVACKLKQTMKEFSDSLYVKQIGLPTGASTLQEIVI